MKLSHCLLAVLASLLPAGGLLGESVKEQGHAYFMEKGCIQCHTYSGAGGTKGPVLDGVGKRLSKDAIENQIRNGSLMMPAFGDALTPEEVAAIAEFLHKSTKMRVATRGR